MKLLGEFIHSFLLQKYSLISFPSFKYVEMAYKISGSNHHKEKLEKLKE